MCRRYLGPFGLIWYQMSGPVNGRVIFGTIVIWDLSFVKKLVKKFTLPASQTGIPAVT